MRFINKQNFFSFITVGTEFRVHVPRIQELFPVSCPNILKRSRSKIYSYDNNAILSNTGLRITQVSSTIILIFDTTGVGLNKKKKKSRDLSSKIDHCRKWENRMNARVT